MLDPQTLSIGSAISRRTWLRIGGFGALGSLLSKLGVANQSAGAPSFGRAKRCILLFLTGGPPQHDTWDMKPDAPADIRGELRPIATNVGGIQFSELFPKLARHADKLCVIRSVTHGDTVHTSAGYTMLTGAPHPLANVPTAELIRPTPDDHPHVSSLVAHYRGKSSRLPPAISLPELIRDANVNDFPGQDGGFLGKGFSPLLIEADETKTKIKMPPLVRPGDLDVQRLTARDRLRREMNLVRLPATVATPGNDLDTWHQKAVDLLAYPQLAKAFDVSSEPPAIHEAYGPHLFGQGCLLARRLADVGIPFVTVYWHYEGPDDSPVWDTHWNNFKHLRQRLGPPTDQAVAALIGDLATRGMLDDTLLLCLGEFGRTPKINNMAGRDHWPHVQSILAAGAGIRGGQVYGASDKQGAYPANDPVAPSDLIATILHLMGIPPEFEIRDRFGRVLPATHGKPMLAIMG